MFGLAALSLALLQCGVEGFTIFPGNSLTHQKITESALLDSTMQVCRSLAQAEGKDFVFPSQPSTAKSVIASCDAYKSSKSFQESITQIKTWNWLTDIRHFFDPPFHIDNEMFEEGRSLITDGLFTVKAANKKGDYLSALIHLGGALHTLQDFYSHSNWVEMGKKLVNSNLIKANTSIGTIADVSRATCRSCVGNDCSNNILEDILQEQILTSGYAATFSVWKPKGKCSHGGLVDSTHYTEPKGGINKDMFTSEHGYLHSQAANMAIAATRELLEDVRGAAGDREFLQMMGIFEGSSKALCFVVEMRKSVVEEMEAVKTVTSSVINTKVETLDEPSAYILVAPNDPNFGPMMRTSDSDVFKAYINSLSAAGGDSPEASLSGLQLALTGSPSNSEIFLFTDTAVRNEDMKNSVIALIEQTRSVVNFVVTETTENLQVSDPQLYRDLARASGGQVIEISKDQLLEATSIITKSSASSLVTLLHATRSSGEAESFTFVVDESIRNLAVYITGTSVDVSLTDPSGVLQNNTTQQTSVVSSQVIGNFQTLWLQTQVGMWEIRIVSTNPYSLKVVGESSIDFLYDFVKELQSPPGGFDLINNRPIAGRSANLMVTLTGSDSATVTEVTLVESSCSGRANGSVEAYDEGEFMVRFQEIPTFEFAVLVKGQNSNQEIFQRQSTTSLRASTLTVSAGGANLILEPGTTQSVPFSIITIGGGGNFTVQASNDQNFSLTSSSSLNLDVGGSANGTVNITAPADASSGTGVTLTIQAVAPGGADTNYAVLRFTVLEKVTDFTPPVCQLQMQSSCSDNCSQTWELSVLVTDGADGSGVDSVSLRQGSGTFQTTTTSQDRKRTLVSYRASCCSADVQLLVVDQVGNVGICSYSVHKSAGPVGSSSTRAFQALLFCFCISILGLSLPSDLGIN